MHFYTIYKQNLYFEGEDQDPQGGDHLPFLPPPVHAYDAWFKVHVHRSRAFSHGLRDASYTQRMYRLLKRWEYLMFMYKLGFSDANKAFTFIVYATC